MKLTDILKQVIREEEDFDLSDNPIDGTKDAELDKNLKDLILVGFDQYVSFMDKKDHEDANSIEELVDGFDWQAWVVEDRAAPWQMGGDRGKFHNASDLFDYWGGYEELEKAAVNLINSNQSLRGKAKRILDKNFTKTEKHGNKNSARFADHPDFKKLRGIKEDIFLKKDPENKQIVVFSDKEGRENAKETISLSKAFRKAGLDWNGKLGKWIGPYSAFAEVNGLIKSHNKIKEVIEDLDALEDFVAAADADPTAKSTIMDNLEAYINDLANATDQATMDAAIQNYLTFYSRFHNYSFTNSMLIFMQKRDATKVAGYNTWKKQNRGVKKGAKAIWIWFPMTVNTKQETDTSKVDFGGVDQAAKSRSFTRFSLGKVYDISDTYELNEKGKVPETPKWSADNTPSEVADELVVRINEFAKDLGINITKDNAKGGEKGFSAGGHINLSSDVEGVGAASTLVHELAHELLHWKEKSPFYMDDADSSSREMKELQAESVSYVVLKHYGLPVTQHPTYLALWKANKEKIMKNLQVIQKCAKYIIDGIDAQESDNKEEL